MAPRRISVSETCRPVLPRHARLKFDDTRQRWVILAPERVLAPDEIAVETCSSAMVHVTWRRSSMRWRRSTPQTALRSAAT